MTEDTGQDGLRALLRAAAAARTSTLLLRGLNPSECHATPTPRKARRESRTPLHSPQTAAEALHFGREVVDVSGAGRPQPSGAVVVGEEDKCADLPDPAGTDPEGTELGDGSSVVPGTGREATEARKCLLASQKEVQRLQRALRSEQDAARSLSAQLSDAEEARVRLERQVLDLEALLDAQTKRADEAAEALIVQQGAITDTQLQEFADEMEEIQEKLAASERNNLQLQSEWEHLQQELREENEKLKGQLAGSQRTREDADAKWDESARGLRQEVEELKQSLESAQAALDEAEASRQSQVQALQCKVAELEEYGRELEAVAEEEVEDLKAKVAELQEANERLAQEAAASRDAAAALGRQSSRDTLSTASPEAAVQASSSVQVNMEMLVGILDGPRRRVRRVMGQWMREALRGSIARGCRAPLLAASSLGAEEEDSGEQRAAGSAPQPRALHHATNLAVGSALNCSVSEGVQIGGGECISEGVQIGGGECISEGVQTNGGSECVSEGVQTMSVVGETKAAQTAQAAGAATHTQTPLSQSVAAAAQTVAPEPGVVVHTQTTAAATTTTATGTADEDEAGAGAMDLVQVAPGPAPAPREVSQMEW